MTTIWPAYEGSDKTSWYPDMQVLMTTSPLACVARPPRSPTSTNPSSSRRTIGSGMLHHPFHHDLAVAQGHHDASAEPPPGKGRDRKSTPLNSSHGYISYAVFCLTKKRSPR